MFFIILELNRRNRKDCGLVEQSEAKSWNGTGGVFDIYLCDSENAVEVYCDLSTDGGNWIVSTKVECEVTS